jgi:hypothetical protein
VGGRWWPVMSDWRAAVHTGGGVVAWVKCVPSRAGRSGGRLRHQFAGATLAS